nr:AraC family transcriptional regulator [Neiella litorisoli]
MRTLLLFVAQLQHQHNEANATLSADPPTLSKHNKVLPLLQRLESDLKLQVSLDDAASYCGMSRSHFSRTFKALLGQNFKDYLLKRKISAAVGLLVNSELTIAEIAYQCEFTDSAYFCAKFKQQMGQTPRQFRHGVWQANEFSVAD